MKLCAREEGLDPSFWSAFFVGHFFRLMKLPRHRQGTWSLSCGRAFRWSIFGKKIKSLLGGTLGRWFCRKRMWRFLDEVFELCLERRQRAMVLLRELLRFWVRWTGEGVSASRGSSVFRLIRHTISHGIRLYRTSPRGIIHPRKQWKYILKNKQQLPRGTESNP